MRAARHHARLEAERRAVTAAIPRAPSSELAEIDRRLAEVGQDRADLLVGQGRYAGTPGGDASRRIIHARQQHRDAQRQAEASDSWRDRRYWRKEAARWAEQESAAETTYVATVGLQVHQLDQASTDLESQTARHERTDWLSEHPEAARRLRSLDRALNPRPRSQR